MKYDSDGMRLTDCCGAASSYYEADRIGYCDTLLCKSCFRRVEIGEGDGNEYKCNEESGGFGT